MKTPVPGHDLADDATGDLAGNRADVFAAARWFDEMWNSSARAVSPTRIEWQCSTWGSGRGRAAWEDVAIFSLVKALFGLQASRNTDARDELIVEVPLSLFAQIRDLVDRLGGEAESWPWLGEEDPDEQIAVAAQAVDRSVDALRSNEDLLEAMRLR